MLVSTVELKVLCRMYLIQAFISTVRHIVLRQVVIILAMVGHSVTARACFVMLSVDKSMAKVKMNMGVSRLERMFVAYNKHLSEGFCQGYL